VQAHFERLNQQGSISDRFDSRELEATGVMVASPIPLLDWSRATGAVGHEPMERPSTTND
jgi:hypothetical protein